MAEVYIAAPALESDQARGLAEALAALGFDAASGAPAEAELGPLTENAKCIVALWSGAAPPTWLAMLSAMALQRGKLICANIREGATPAALQSAPKVDLSPRDRTAFKAKFGALVVEIDKLAPTKANAAALPDALIKARSALLKRPAVKKRNGVAIAAPFLIATAVLFAVGFGAGRVIQATRTGSFFVTTAPAEASTTSAPAVSDPLALAWTRLEQQPWQQAAQNLGDSDTIKARAARGDSRAQALACLGHLAGAEGFLPSPTAAREYCDASSAQEDAGGLYLSWVLQQSAPHAGIDSATARERLSEAARRGWIAAQIDYAELLYQRGLMEAHAEAGRLWLAAAERGDPRGQFHYARWLRDSPAGPRDPAAALPYLERAAERGQVEALHLLATLYRDGRGVPRDPARAKTLYDRAAQQNYAASMYNLADMLRTGTAQERARSIELFQALICLRDELQIRPMAERRLLAMQAPAVCRWSVSSSDLTDLSEREETP